MSLFEYKPNSNPDDLLFWLAIDISNTQKDLPWNEYDIDTHLKNLTLYLSKLKKEQLIIFEKTLQKKLSQLYKAEIAELSMIIECDFTKDHDIYNFDSYLSDDGFIYFRCWLILKGKTFFDDIRSDIQSFINGKYSFDISNCWAEELLYCADEAYLLNNNDESETPIRDAVYDLYPDHHYDSAHFSMDKQLLHGAELQIKYPKLVKTICALRN